MRSFLKLYASLDASKLAGFLDADEEEMVQQMMAVKGASRCVSRVGGGGGRNHEWRGGGKEFVGWGDDFDE